MSITWHFINYKLLVCKFMKLRIWSSGLGTLLLFVIIVNILHFKIITLEAVPNVL